MTEPKKPTDEPETLPGPTDEPDRPTEPTEPETLPGPTDEPEPGPAAALPHG